MQESIHTFWLRIQTAGFRPTPVDFAVQTAPGAIPISHIQTDCFISLILVFSLYFIFFCCCLGFAVFCRIRGWTVTCMPYCCMHHLQVGWSLFDNKPSNSRKLLLLLLLLPLLFSRLSIHLPLSLPSVVFLSNHHLMAPPPPRQRFAFNFTGRIRKIDKRPIKIEKQLTEIHAPRYSQRHVMALGQYLDGNQEPIMLKIRYE